MPNGNMIRGKIPTRKMKRGSRSKIGRRQGAEDARPKNDRWENMSIWKMKGGRRCQTRR
jgi:hypothetical protein